MEEEEDAEEERHRVDPVAIFVQGFSFVFESSSREVLVSSIIIIMVPPIGTTAAVPRRRRKPVVIGTATAEVCS